MTKNPVLRVVLVTLVVIALFIAVSILFVVAGRSSEDSSAGDAGTETTIATSGATATTEGGDVESMISLSSPDVGAVVASPLVLAGDTTADIVAYRLKSGDRIFAEGTIAAGGAFEDSVEFVNDCCLEMTLDVWDPTADPDATFGITIPLAYPESEPS